MVTRGKMKRRGRYSRVGGSSSSSTGTSVSSRSKVVGPKYFSSMNTKKVISK